MLLNCKLNDAFSITKTVMMSIKPLWVLCMDSPKAPN